MKQRKLLRCLLWLIVCLASLELCFVCYRIGQYSCDIRSIYFFALIIGLVVLATFGYFLIRLYYFPFAQNEDCIPTPCPVVYLDEEGDCYTLPYLHLEVKHLVWGAKVKDCFFCKTEVPNLSWFEAKDIAAHNPRATIPSLNDLKKARSLCRKFNATMEILRQNGVEADDLNGFYWSEKSYDQNDAWMVQMDISVFPSPYLSAEAKEKQHTLRFVSCFTDEILQKISSSERFDLWETDSVF